MRTTVLRRVAAAAGILILLGATAACGDDSSSSAESPDAGSSSTEPGDEETGESGETEAAEGEYPYDLSDPGDDLLGAARRGVVITGTDTEMSWKFPDSYAQESAQQASSKEGGGTFTLTTGAKPTGTDPQTEAEATVERAAGGVEAEAYEVTVGDRPFWVATVDAAEGKNSLRAFFYSPEDQESTYAVLLTSAATLDETPDERVEELHQMVGSLEFEPAGSAAQ